MSQTRPFRGVFRVPTRPAEACDWPSICGFGVCRNHSNNVSPRCDPGRASEGSKQMDVFLLGARKTAKNLAKRSRVRYQASITIQPRLQSVQAKTNMARTFPGAIVDLLA